MTEALRFPPRGFETLAREHLWRKKWHILDVVAVWLRESKKPAGVRGHYRGAPLLVVRGTPMKNGIARGSNCARVRGVVAQFQIVTGGEAAIVVHEAMTMGSQGGATAVRGYREFKSGGGKRAGDCQHGRHRRPLCCCWGKYRNRNERPFFASRSENNSRVNHRTAASDAAVVSLG